MERKNIETVVVCSSASFYTQVVEVQKQLEKLNFKVIIPLIAEKMKESGDFRVETYKTWFKDNDYQRKACLMKQHFKEIERGDMILVLNYKKNDKDGYIGGAVLSEMAVASYLGKPIYILNPIDSSSNFMEEILGMLPVIINGDLSKIK